MVCLLTAVADGFDINVFGLVVPSLIKEWNLTPVMVGMLGSIGLSGMIFGSLVLGPIADKFGKARALMLATSVYGVFTVGVGFSQTFTQFAICRFIAGIGLAGAFPVVVAYVSEYSPKAIRSRLTVWTTSGMALGTVIAALIAVKMLPAYGWRGMFFLAAIPLLLLMFQYRLPESMAYYIDKGQNDKIVKVLQAANPAFVPLKDDKYQLDKSNQGKVSLVSLFSNGLAKNTIIFWIMMFFNYIFIYGVLTWLTQLLKIQGWSLGWSLFFTLVWNLGFILGIPLCGWLQDKFGGKRTLSIGLLVLSALVFVDSVIGGNKNALALAIALFLTGAAQHGLSGVAGSYIAQSYPIAFRGTGTGMGYGIGRVGAVFGPMIAALLLTYGFSGSMTLRVFACIPIISAIAISLSTDRTIFKTDISSDTVDIKG
ncbi:MFS transporter [Desulfosporosinus fructosivorans]|uniref:MFS transporter n=2 Tax=Desulfosporosinus fructosivorans TaxID=2018669 RepID=A0A4Z0R6A8_9FIRM|nr:MFS transporter [Desulfosporosinus fructosivorans]